ncbi:MAG: PilZ domain-containing protein [Deltaproteobacteria bacterium]|jgi:c-di-GMP-binding flagellar brake protein YcgR|nr:PilZ domain-containing protein [Deltaproteobacteria bacterium]
MSNLKKNLSEEKVISVNPGSEKVEERRRFKRFPIKLNAKYLLGENHKKWKPFMVINISREGMGMEVYLQERIPIDSILQIEIIVPEKEKSVMAIGILRWIRELDKKMNYLGGVDLTKIDSRDKWMLLDYAYDEWAEEV